MKIWHLIRREIRYRRLTAILVLVSVSAAMTAWVGAIALLRAHDLQTDNLLRERERQTQRDMQQMEDDYRRIMRDLGYNVMIVPEEQDMARLRAQGYPETTMPYAYVERLAHGGIETLNHLLPVLQQRVSWPEADDMEIILSGTSGQVPITHLTHFLTPDGQAYRNPIMPTIPPGELVLGHDVARRLSLEPGDETVLLGTPFRVRSVNAAEGTSDDIAVWCDLEWMQEQLGLQDQINVILALECVCAADSLGKIIAEVNSLVPGVQVMEFSSRVRARAEARNRAEAAARTAMASEREHRETMAASQQRFASVLTPLVIGGAVVWMFFLFLGNVRERTVEIGILRAIGIREQTILAIFLLKSLLLGLLGAFAGFVIGHALAAWWTGIPLFSKDFVAILDPGLLVIAMIIAPALCALAAWLPAVRAIRKDPASILCEA